jgi:hypothetical protein
VKLPCGGRFYRRVDTQSDGNERVTFIGDDASGEQGGDPMLVIAIMAMLAIIVTIFALIVASPLYRTLATALDSWAEVPAPVRRRRY